jgi:hypothetical protein
MLIGNSFPQFKDSDGSVLNAGYIYFGVVNLNPETNPVSVYWDTAFTQPAAQPIRTLNGFIVRDGTIANLYTNTNYSTTVKNKNGTLLYSLPDSSNFDIGSMFLTSIGASLIGWIRNATNAIKTTISDWLNWQSVSVLEFMTEAERADVLAGTLLIDVGPKIQLAFDANKGKVVFPKGALKTNQEIDNKGISFYGHGRALSSIVAGSAIRSVFKYSGQNATAEDLFIDGANLSNHGVFLAGANSSSLQSCGIERTKLDGVMFDAVSNNSAVVIEKSLIRNLGTTYSTGDASTAAGNTVATLTGSADLTTLGIRPNIDYIKVNGEPIARAINSITSNTVTVYPPFTTTQSSASFKILQGSAVCIQRNGDNSKIKIKDSTLQNAALAGIDDHALYGATSIGNIIEVCEFGRIIGRNRLDGNHEVVYSPEDIANYNEVTPSGALRLEYSTNATVEPSLFSNKLNDISINGSIGCGGLLVRMNGEVFQNKVQFCTNITTFNSSFGITYNLTQSSGASDIVFNLPAVPSGANETLLRTLYESKVVMNFTNMGGKQTTIKCAAGTINSIAGSTGVVIRGNYRTVIAIFDGSNWLLSPVSISQGSYKINSGGGVGAGSTYTANITGFDCTSGAISVSPYGLGENTASDKYKVGFAITARSSSGCTIILQNNGVSEQTILADVAFAS